MLAGGHFSMLADNANGRSVSITDRLQQSLSWLWEHSTANQDALVFGITSDIKHAFK